MADVAIPAVCTSRVAPVLALPGGDVDCQHGPAPGIEPGAAALSERCTAVVLDRGTGTGRIIRFLAARHPRGSTYSAGAPGLFICLDSFDCPSTFSCRPRPGQGSRELDLGIQVRLLYPACQVMTPRRRFHTVATVSVSAPGLPLALHPRK